MEERGTATRRAEEHLGRPESQELCIRIRKKEDINFNKVTLDWSRGGSRSSSRLLLVGLLRGSRILEDWLLLGSLMLLAQAHEKPKGFCIDVGLICNKMIKSIK